MKKKDIFLTGIIVLMIIVLYFIGKIIVKPKYGDSDKNPYDLDIERISKINKEKYCNYNSKKINLDLHKPKAIAIDENDNIYISGDSSILIYNSVGKKLSEFTIGKTAFALCVNNFKIYAGVREHVEIYSNKGKQLSSWASLGEKAFITSIAISTDKVYLSEANGKIIYEFTTDGKKLKTIGSRDTSNNSIRFVIPSYYFDVAIDTNGFLWAANTGKHKLVNINRNGELRTSWGETSYSVEGFCGCCNPTHFAIMDDGSFITSEKGIVRIKKYNSGGKFMCAIAGAESFKKKSQGLDIAINSKQEIFVLEPMTQLIHIFKEN